jgi:hypothetical protein
MSQIGILFDIDDLGGGTYGFAAYRLLFETLGRDSFFECGLSDGDTSETLCGSVRHYCIAIETDDAAKCTAIRQTIRNSNATGFIETGSRIIEDESVSHQPLVQAGCVDSTGQLNDCDTTWIATAWQQCTANSANS